MISSKTDLIAAIDNNQTFDYLFFWQATPSPDGRITAACLSQWWAGHPFRVGSLVYRTAEHYMMVRKATIFGDIDIARQIYTAETSQEAKRLGRMAKGFDAARWERERDRVIREGNYQKFRQHPELKAFLLGTRDKVLVEASPYDPVWGIGLDERDRASGNPKEWPGLNLLGFILMQVREDLRELEPQLVSFAANSR